MSTSDLLSRLPSSPGRILVTRLDGLGDIVLGTTLLASLRRRWSEAVITLLVRPQFANIAAILPGPLEVVPLPFDPREPVNGRETELTHALRDLANRLPSHLAVIAEYNRTWAGELLAARVAPVVLAFDGPTGLNVTHEAIVHALGVTPGQGWHTVHVEATSAELTKYRLFAAALGCDEPETLPELVVTDGARNRAAQLLRQQGVSHEQTWVIFPGSGERSARSLPPETWAGWLGHLQQRGMTPLLLGSHADAPMLDHIRPHLSTSVPELLLATDDFPALVGVLALGRGYIGMDTGPMHVAAALGKPTLGVFGGGHFRTDDSSVSSANPTFGVFADAPDRARFLPTGPRTAAVRMPISCFGCEWFCPFDRRSCVKEIPAVDLFRAGDEFLARVVTPASPDHPARGPLLYDIAPPTFLSGADLGGVMRLHRRLLVLSHERIEHDAYVQGILNGLQQRLDALAGYRPVDPQVEVELRRLAAIISDMSLQNQARDAAIAHLNNTAAAMTDQNTQRDAAIAHVSAMIEAMTRQNQARDNAIAHLNDTATAMTEQNTGRDRAIAGLSEAVHAMSRQLEEKGVAAAAAMQQNTERDGAVARLSNEVEALTRQNRSQDQALDALRGEVAVLREQLAAEARRGPLARIFNLTSNPRRD